jgi:two-component sensor histidine kinase
MATRVDARAKTAYRGLSTGIKMLIWLFAALLPLGLVAILASLYSARDYRANRQIETRTIVAESAAKLTAAIARTTLALRTNAATIARSEARRLSCDEAVVELEATQPSGTRFAFFGPGSRPLCATRGFKPDHPALIVGPGGHQLEMSDDGSGISLAVSDSSGAIVGVALLPRTTLAEVARPRLEPGSYGLTLWQENEALPLAEIGDEGPLGQRFATDAPLGETTLSLQMVIIGSPIRAVEVLMVLLPILMWIAAAGIGWLVVDRLLLRPLGKLHNVVAAYGAGEKIVDMPDMASPAQEIERLGDAFLTVTRTVARHEAELEEGLARQTKLTREVHHRVKNNLQVVASLINLHARGATSPDVAAAYASIQRRVDALAVVHRNHYAELEENRGVALRPLIGELASNLRATAGPEHSAMGISLDVEPVYVTQDVAVPVAFLLTELVELAMLCDPRATIAILLARAGERTARLELRSLALRSGGRFDTEFEGRFGRVITGLSRQLRSKLVRDEAGTFAIDLQVAD